MTDTNTIRDFQIGRVVSNTFEIFGRNAFTFLALTTLLTTPSLILAAYLGLGASMPLHPVNPVHAGTILCDFGLWAVVSLPLMSILTGALVSNSFNSQTGGTVSFAASLTRGLKICLPLIVFSLLLGIAVTIGLVLLVIPGIILMMAWAVATPSLIIEKTGIFGAFARSAELTKGHRWAIFGLFALTIIAGAIVSVSTSVVLQTPGADRLGLYKDGAYLIASGIVQILISTIVSIGSTALYVELRTQKECLLPHQCD